MTPERALKYLVDAIPQGPHPTPHNDWVDVRLDALQAIIDDYEWTNTGLAEWRAEALASGKRVKAAHAAVRIAVEHLRGVLDGADQNKAERLARDWLESIGEGTP